MTQFVDAVGQSTGHSHAGEPGEAPGPAQKPEALLGLGGRGRRRSGIGVGATGRALELLLSQGTGGAKNLGSRRKRPARQRRQLHGGRWRGHLGADCQRTSNHCRKWSHLSQKAKEGKGRGEWRGVGRREGRSDSEKTITNSKVFQWKNHRPLQSEIKK